MTVNIFIISPERNKIYEQLISLQEELKFRIKILINKDNLISLPGLIVTDDFDVPESSKILVLGKNIATVDDLRYHIFDNDDSFYPTEDIDLSFLNVDSIFTTVEPEQIFDEDEEDDGFSNVIEREGYSYSLPYKTFTDLTRHVSDKLSIRLRGGIKRPPFNWFLEEFSDWTHVTVGTKTMLTSRRSKVNTMPTYGVLSSYAGLGGSTLALNIASVLKDIASADRELNKFSVYNTDKLESLFVDLDFGAASVSKFYKLDQLKKKNLFSLYCGYDLMASSSKNILKDLPEISSENLTLLPVSPLHSLSETNKEKVLQTDFSILHEALTEQCSSVVYDFGAIPRFKDGTGKELYEFIKPLTDLRMQNLLFLVDASNELSMLESLEYLTQIRQYISDKNSYVYLTGKIVPVRGNVQAILKMKNLLTHYGINNFEVLSNPLPYFADETVDKCINNSLKKYIRKEVLR